MEKSETEELRTARVQRRLPHIFGRNEPLPDGIEGAHIVRIGALKNSRLVEGGGLVIDYQPAGHDSVRRVILAFDGTAMWTEAIFPEAPVRESESHANTA